MVFGALLVLLGPFGDCLFFLFMLRYLHALPPHFNIVKMVIILVDDFSVKAINFLVGSVSFKMTSF